MLKPCYDLKLAYKEYKTISIKCGTIRFKGVVIYYCPFCGQHLYPKKEGD